MLSQWSLGINGFLTVKSSIDAENFTTLQAAEIILRKLLGVSKCAVIAPRTKEFYQKLSMTYVEEKRVNGSE